MLALPCEQAILASRGECEAKAKLWAGRTPEKTLCVMNLKKIGNAFAILCRPLKRELCETVHVTFGESGLVTNRELTAANAA
jgi:hypothetical protein